MAKLNDKQYAAIAILSQRNRGGMTFKQVAEAVGVTEMTIHNWRKRDDFNDELKRQVMRETLDRLPEIVGSMADAVIEDRNAAMARTLLQAHGMLTEKVEVASQTTTVDVDSIKADIERLKND